MKLLLTIITISISLIGFTQDAAQSIIKGNQLYQQSQFDLAETQYRKALEYDPDNEKAKYNLANALQKQNKFDEAAKLLDDLASSSKDNSLKSAAYYNQGVAYTKMKDLDASIESYKKSLRLNPNDQEARENLEKALLQKKNQQQQSQQKQSQSNMSQKEAQQKLDMLNQKEKKLHQNKDKEQQGSAQAQDW
jgi:Ca-activated chloride channel family protein